MCCCSSFPLKIHLERAFLPAVWGFSQIFSCFLSFRRRGKCQRRDRFPPFNPHSPKKMKNAKENEKFPLFPTNHEKGKMTGIFLSLFSNTGKILKRRMKSEFSPQSLTRATAGFCQTDNKKAANLFRLTAFRCRRWRWVIQLCAAALSAEIVFEDCGQ